ncbi:MAG TPA: helix-turn-helix domain-containing protein [Clostridia bacterium]
MFARQLQHYVEQVKSETSIEIFITDDTGAVIACPHEELLGTVDPTVHSFLSSSEDDSYIDGMSLKKVYAKGKTEFVIYSHFPNDEGRHFLTLTSIAIIAMKTNYDEKFDRPAFLKGIISGTISPGDISTRSKELHVPVHAPRAVFIIRTVNANDSHVHEIIQGLFPNRTRDYIVVMDKEHTVLIKEVKASSDDSELQKIAMSITDTITSEIMVKSYVGIGTISENLTDIEKSYKEALLSLKTGSIFSDDRYIFFYSHLGLGRLIYQMSEESCSLFLNEFFNDDTIDFNDQDTMNTIGKFFENNLNISETSRQLYLHRNTLVYRLDKIKKTCGLDLRIFDDAVTFKVAMLVKKYLEKKAINR